MSDAVFRTTKIENVICEERTENLTAVDDAIKQSELTVKENLRPQK